jgi:hypothetical protein
VCPRCETYQRTYSDRLWHFSFNIKERQILLGKDEYLDARIAETRLDEERQRVEQMLKERPEEHVKRQEALAGQVKAIEAAIALCRRLASG